MNILSQKIRQLVRSDRRMAEVVRFGIVGVFASVLQYAVYVLCVDVLSVRAVPSTVISYVVSFVFNFFLSSYFTFRSGPSARKGLGFIVSHLVNLGLQTALVALFKGIVGNTLALLPAMAICVPVNFLLVRFCFKKL